MGHLSLVLEVLSVVIAAVATGLAWSAARSSLRSATSAAETSKEMAEASLGIAEQQKVLQSQQVQLQYYTELRHWADSALDTLGSLMSLCHLDPARTEFNFREKHVEYLNQLSALIDRGRWFLPNFSKDMHGREKDVAFQGFRHPALDQLVYAFDIAKAIDYKGCSGHINCYKELEGYRRKFTSIIQTVIRTEDWVRVMEKIKLETLIEEKANESKE